MQGTTTDDTLAARLEAVERRMADIAGPEWLSAEELAVRLRVHHATIRRAGARGELEKMCIGRLVRYRVPTSTGVQP